jgi:hypothetical protein
MCLKNTSSSERALEQILYLWCKRLAPTPMLVGEKPEAGTNYGDCSLDC